VLVTVSDKKLQHSTDGTTIDYYNPDVASATDYAPFGLNLVGRDTTFGSHYAYGFNGKLKDKSIEDNAVDYDYGDRIQDPRLGRWLSIDPLTKKYPSLSPYNFANNSPIITIDKGGQDIIVLCNPNGASEYGHMAILVGNDKDGWVFISKEGRQKDHWYSNEVTGGPSLKMIVPFKSLDAFKQAQKTDPNLGGYTKSVHFTTNASQDQAAIDAAEKAAGSWYNVLYSNCADAVSDALTAVGLDPGYSKPSYVHIDDGIFDNDDYLDARPNIRFAQILGNNKTNISQPQQVSPTPSSLTVNKKIVISGQNKTIPQFSKTKDKKENKEKETKEKGKEKVFVAPGTYDTGTRGSSKTVDNSLGK
jgi:RHS repeat-associated protein